MARHSCSCWVRFLSILCRWYKKNFRFFLSERNSLNSRFLPYDRIETEVCLHSEYACSTEQHVKNKLKYSQPFAGCGINWWWHGSQPCRDYIRLPDVEGEQGQSGRIPRQVTDLILYYIRFYDLVMNRKIIWMWNMNRVWPSREIIRNVQMWNFSDITISKTDRKRTDLQPASIVSYSHRSRSFTRYYDLPYPTRFIHHLSYRVVKART